SNHHHGGSAQSGSIGDGEGEGVGSYQQVEGGFDDRGGVSLSVVPGVGGDAVAIWVERAGAVEGDGGGVGRRIAGVVGGDGLVGTGVGDGREVVELVYSQVNRRPHEAMVAVEIDEEGVGRVHQEGGRGDDGVVACIDAG